MTDNLYCALEVNEQPEEHADVPSFSENETENNLEPDSHDSISSAYLSLAPGVQEAMKRLSETALQASQVQVNLPKSSISALTTFSENVLKAFSRTVEVSQTLTDALKPVCDSLSELVGRINWKGLSESLEGLDFEGLQEGARIWGDHGWVVSDLSPSEIRNAPMSLSDADAYYLQYMTQERIQDLFDNVLAKIPRKKDFKECVVLYEQKHYKPCAMMLCSLIEGQLIRRIPKSTRRRNGEVALKKMQDLDNDLVDAIWLLNTLSTYSYFFHYADNFNRAVEGELNRNFLLHGMMYKPVLKRTCVKLFLLLESIVIAMPDYMPSH